MEHDAWFFIGIFVFIFLIWIATGGPLHSISFTGQRLAAPQELGGGTYLKFPRAPFRIGNTTVTLRDPLDDGGASGSASETSVPAFVGGSTFGTPSPYRSFVRIGYFSTFQTFFPPLPQNCPIPPDELKTFYGSGYISDAACIDYVDRLSRCQIALSPPLGASGSCQGFLVKYLHYNGCVEAHKNDGDFEGNTWRIYLGRTTPMWRAKHELVKLLDVNGKTVDAFSY